MARSKREPWATDGYKGSKRRQFYKNHANRVIRKAKDVPDGMAYKRFTDSWDICDYRFYVEVKKKDDQYYEPEFWKYSRK